MIRFIRRWFHKTEEEKRKQHNRSVARRGHGMIFLPTNVDVGNILDHVGGLPPAQDSG